MLQTNHDSKTPSSAPIPNIFEKEMVLEMLDVIVAFMVSPSDKCPFPHLTFLNHLPYLTPLLAFTISSTISSVVQLFP
jgi:hypothetical protein